ncbi:hypothetical protein [Hydrococcus rivularis]|nr:hypothetical protein [Hydrococcus rivularis]
MATPLIGGNAKPGSEEEATKVRRKREAGDRFQLEKVTEGTLENQTEMI